MNRRYYHSSSVKTPVESYALNNSLGTYAEFAIKVVKSVFITLLFIRISTSNSVSSQSTTLDIPSKIIEVQGISGIKGGHFSNA